MTRRRWRMRAAATACRTAAPDACRELRCKICTLIAEDTDRVKRAVKNDAHTVLRDPRAIAGTEFSKVRELPLTKIVDTPHLAEKGQSAALQVANFCAYFIMRRI